MSGLLAKSPAEIISELLVDLGLGTAPDDESTWPAFVSMLPDSPDNCINVTDTEGIHDGRSMIDGTVYTHYGFQIMIRAKDHPTGWLKAHTIATSLDTLVNRTYVPMGNTTFQIQSISRGTVLSIGIDETTKRRLFTINCIAPIRQLPGTGSYYLGD